MSDEPAPRRDRSEAIRENDVILFMKGTPEQPDVRLLRAHRRRRCRRSTRRSRRSTSCPTRASARSSRALSDWPTIPQLFVDGELVGGADIVTEMYESGELAEALGVEAPSASPPRRRPAPTGTGPARHREPPELVRGIGSRRWPSRSSPTRPDYLPPALLADLGVREVVAVRRLGRRSAARVRDRRPRRLLRRAAHRRDGARDVPAVRRRRARGLRAAARRGPRHRVDPPLGRAVRAPWRPPSRRGPPRRAPGEDRGPRLRNGLRRPRPRACSRRRAPPRTGLRREEVAEARPPRPRGPADVVLRRHAGVPAPRRTGRRRAEPGSAAR